METIDLTPSWQGILPALIAIVSNAETVEARKQGEHELRTMAKAADRYNELVPQLEVWQKAKLLVDNITGVLDDIDSGAYADDSEALEALRDVIHRGLTDEEE